MAELIVFVGSGLAEAFIKMKIDYNILCDKLGYHFNDKGLLYSALTHRSVDANNNERLEFLGDSIVNFLIAEALFHRFPKAKEGHLSRLRASLVKGETLAELAQELELGGYLSLGPGESKTGGHRRSSILADAIEAIIAAIYFDSDLETCRKLVLTWFESRLAKTSLDQNLKDPKTQLQEFLQGKKYPLPTYNIVKAEGEAHKQTFYIECVVEGISYTSEGVGSSRRRAEQEAAEIFLAMAKGGFKQ